MMSRMPSLIDETDEAPSGASRGGGASLSERVRHFFATPAGKATLGALVLGALAFGGYRFFGAVGSGGAEWPRIRVMDPETRDLRWQEVKPGERMPYVNPKTGERTMYVVEYCFDNACGPNGGTPVVLNNYLNIDEPTTCPECSAEVRPHNPRPQQYANAQPADW